MQRQQLKRSNLPDAPGVYFFVGAKGKILYIGKATSLKDRVKSYFSNDLIATRGPRIVDMVTLASRVKCERTDSVLEALILEANLIKKHQPPYNVDQKDNKSWNYVVITDEAYPRVLVVRGRELAVGSFTGKEKARFGPYPQGSALREALEIVRKIFPFYDTKRPVDGGDKHTAGKIAFNRQIGRYPHMTDPIEYQKSIRHIMTLFEGRKKALLKELQVDMKRAVRAQEFERAQVLKRQVFALKHVQDVALLKDEYKHPNQQITESLSGYRIEAYDIAHISGTKTVGVMTVVVDGEKVPSQYRKFRIAKEQNDDIASLKEMLLRRLGHPEWPYPDLIVVDGHASQMNAALAVLKSIHSSIPVVGVVKDERHKPKSIAGDKELSRSREKEILLANSEAHRFAVSYLRLKMRKGIRG
jgi:excinuclease ABC subunit C